MLTWGYGKLDHAPAGELLDQIAHRLEMDVSLYHHQAVSNMFYSLARLQKYNPSMCSAVETHVTTHIEDFSPQVRHLLTAEFSSCKPVSNPSLLSPGKRISEWVPVCCRN